MLWQPLNLTEVCPVNTQLSACSDFAFVYLNLLVRLFGDSRDRRIQQCRGEEGRIVEGLEKKREEYDFIVVGAGAAGCVVANRLSAVSKWKVLLLEAGMEQPDVTLVPSLSTALIGSNIDWAYTTEPDGKSCLARREQRCGWPRGKVMGGSSSINSMAYIRGNSLDYDTWADMGNEGWSYKDVLPYFKKSEKNLNIEGLNRKYHGVDGEQSISRFPYVDRPSIMMTDAFHERGLPIADYNGAYQMTTMQAQAVAQDGERVLPYFKKSEKNLNIEELSRKYHGVDGEQSVARFSYIDEPSYMLTDAFHERGLPIADYNGAFQLSTMQAQAVIAKDGQRVSTNNAFIQPIRYKRKNLTVKIKAEAFKILINKNKVAYGVKYIQDGQVYTAYAKKEVIVSAGVINSPKLLMLSGVGPKEHLSKLNITVKKDLAVGENLHDHVTFNGILIALPNRTSTRVSNEKIVQELYDYKKMKVKHGLLASNGPVNAIAFIKTDPDLPAPDIQYQVGHLFLDEYIREPEIYDGIYILPTPYYDGLLPRAMNLVPKSRGKLLLNPENPHGKPLIYANYLGDPADLIPIIKGVRFLLSLENTKAFKSLGAYFDRTPLKPCRDHPWGTDEYIVCLARAYTSSCYHPVGTCKMGPKSDKKAVVDPKLRVYGISRLRVIDSSIMPVVIRGNTHAPSIMIGERGVAFVIEEWLKKPQNCHH
ncbi:hypothetical protein PYW07_010385 [Mythimna separata]|uniref:Glucose dehydrogenase [FAD, quinone]-like n=1 Tax=Mythimna separata TaxID=271217 RepID=A0AAD7YA10_MYTSE|nr:hypothetical protein PYW07_010385 [Mythimna separata]